MSPTIKIELCDCCNKEIKKEKILIYNFEYWSNNFGVMKKDFILENDIAGMFCSSICLGNFLLNIIKEKRVDKINDMYEM